VTQENPQEIVDSYQFPDKYFDKLREYENVHEGMYSVVQGGLYRVMADPEEAHFTDKDAMQVTRLLNRKRIEEAEELVYEVLDK